jgi:vacuolar-type H+-ATPase subunit D/Vma8
MDLDLDVPVAVPRAVEACPKIDPADPEFARVQYLLRLALRSASARVLAIHSVSSPHLNLQFDKASKQGLQLDSWIDTAMLDDHNTLQRIVERGFALPDCGAVFPTGEIGGLDQDVNNAGVRRYEFLLCKLAVGRSYLMESQQVTAQTEVPQGFNSVYVHFKEREPTDDAQPSGVDDDDRETVFPDVPSFTPRDAHLLTYHHSYFLKDPAQVLPVFWVSFAYDPAADSRIKSADALTRAKAVYEHLKRSDALEDAISLRGLIQKLEKKGLLTDADISALQKACGKQNLGSGGANTTEITKEDIDAGAFGFCPTHQKQPLEFWDSVWNMPVCVYCKMVGSHSAGDAATHPLIPIAEAYTQALAAARKEDRLLETRRGAIIHHLRVVDERLERVNKNAAEVEERIYAILQAAMARLQELTQHKLSVLLGEEAELRRQLEHIDWIEGFLNYQKGILGARSFLDAWRSHQALRTMAHQKPLLRAQIDVFPDLKCEGELRVITDAHLREQQIVAAEQQGSTQRAQMANQASTSYRQTLFSNFASPALRRGGAGLMGFDQAYGAGDQYMPPVSAQGPDPTYSGAPAGYPMQQQNYGMAPAGYPPAGYPVQQGYAPQNYPQQGYPREEVHTRSQTSDELWRESLQTPSSARR